MPASHRTAYLSSMVVNVTSDINICSHSCILIERLPRYRTDGPLEIDFCHSLDNAPIGANTDNT